MPCFIGSKSDSYKGLTSAPSGMSQVAEAGSPPAQGNNCELLEVVLADAAKTGRLIHHPQQITFLPRSWEMWLVRRYNTAQGLLRHAGGGVFGI